MTSTRALLALTLSCSMLGCSREKPDYPQCGRDECQPFDMDDDSSSADGDDDDDDDGDDNGGRDVRDGAIELRDASSTSVRDSSTPPRTERDAATDGTVAAPADAGTTPPAPPIGGPAVKSPGCGSPMWPEAGTKTIDIDGTAREYIVALPQGYDTNRPYRLIFAWHGLGGTAASIARSWYGLSRRADNSAIFVAGQGLPTQNDGGAGWPNTGGRDVAFVQKLLALLRTSYCIDDTRVFSTGMSYGGIMSNTLGCQMGDVLRAIAPMAGSGPSSFRGATCKGQPAVWLSHGNMDTVVQFTAGQASRDHWVKTNHCQTQTMPATPSPCVAYQDCDPGHPVHWCEFAGGHTVPQFAAEGIWNFFAQF